MKASLILCFLLVFIFPVRVSAEVVLNEIGTSTTSDWFEIYFIPDGSTPSAQLSEYLIKDSGSYEKILEGEIAPGEYLSFGVGNKFNNSGDTIYFYRGTTLLGSVTYSEDGTLCAPVGDQAIGRSPNGTGDFSVLVASTRDSANSASQYTCPTPTPSLTPTSSPTPSPTSTPTLTSSPTPTPSLAPEKTEKPEVDDDYQYSENEILGLRDELKTPEPSESPEPVEQEKKFPALAGVFIVGGMVFIGAAGYPFAKTRWLESKKNKYNKRHEQKNSLLKKIS